MYQVVASDLDGTLLSPDHTLSPYAKETLKLLTARGVHLCLPPGATTWMWGRSAIILRLNRT
ncbi:protein YigL [Enterobacter cloacae]|uniref:Protein YigL n=1 Tax=Enterobacter cloacae TaxID=550 RepID=A0A377LQ14_ENTCL|nr:protein YigL [Enterobacter cloacae]